MAASSNASGRARLLLGLAIVAAYASALGAPFHFDDRGAVLEDPAIHSLSGYLRAAASGLRPLLKATYAVDWATGGGAAWTFHLTNVLVHALNVELVMRLCGAAVAPARRWPFTNVELRGATVLAGVWFALHPIQTEAVTYVSGRSSSLSTSFALLALLAHAHGVRAADRRFIFGLAPLSFLAAVLVKETVLVLPLGILCWDVFVERAPARTLLRRHAAWWALGAASLAALVTHDRYFRILYEVLGARSLSDSVVAQLSGLRYLGARLALLERPCLDPGLWLARPPLAVTVATAVALVAVVALSVRERKARPAMSFGLLWFLLFAFVPYVLLPRADVINERHAYVANAGLALAVGVVAGSALARVPAAWVRATPLLLAAVLTPLTVRRNLEYRSEVTLWRSTSRVAPKNPRAHNNLGVAYERERRYAEARAAYARALALEPRFRAARDNLARLNARPPSAP